MIGFDFKAELDDFDSKDSFFSLGTDPAGDWFVMTEQNSCEVRLCDHHVYHLYDFWLNPNHLLAWALRCARHWPMKTGSRKMMYWLSGTIVSRESKK